MNLLYTTNLRNSTVRGSLIVAFAALALIVLLLWFGSIRSPDSVAADEARLYSECPAGMLEYGEDLSGATSIGTGNSATQEKSAGESPDIQFLGTSLLGGEEQNDGRCIFIGNPCWQDPGPWNSGQSDVQASRVLRTY